MQGSEVEGQPRRYCAACVGATGSRSTQCPCAERWAVEFFERRPFSRCLADECEHGIDGGPRVGCAWWATFVVPKIDALRDEETRRNSAALRELTAARGASGSAGLAPPAGGWVGPPGTLREVLSILGPHLDLGGEVGRERRFQKRLERATADPILHPFVPGGSGRLGKRFLLDCAHAMAARLEGAKEVAAEGARAALEQLKAEKHAEAVRDMDREADEIFRRPRDR